MTWVYDLPLWAACIVFIGGASVIGSLGLLVVRRRFSQQQITHNDVAGAVMTTIGTVLAVLLTFMVVTVWQEYDAAAALVETEASDIIDLFHEAVAFPPAVSAPLRASIQRYVGLVVHDEWPLMREGRQSLTATRVAREITFQVERYEPKTMGQQTAQADALRHVHSFLDARRSRLFNNQESVPGLVWSMMIFVAAITLGSTYFFRVANVRAHMLMTIALASVIGATFLMIAELDLPFRGPLQVSPAALSHATPIFKGDVEITSEYLPNGPGSTQP